MSLNPRCEVTILKSFGCIALPLSITTKHALAERYARIYAYLRQNGRPIPTNDLWIAASAMEHSVELLTADAHFSHLPQIIVKHIVT